MINIQELHKDSAVNKRGNKPFGVRGWLLIFVLVITVLIPIVAIYNLFTEWFLMGFYLDLNYTAGWLLLAKTIFYILVVIFGIIAGIILWKVKRNAIKIAKSFLVTIFIVGIIYQVILTYLLSPYNMYGLYLDMGSIIGYLTFFVVWYQYLRKSKRVKNTYLQTPQLNNSELG